MTLILGIDPGLNTTGWGVIRKVTPNQDSFVASGVIKTRPSDDLATRLAVLHKALLKVIETYNPQLAAIEETFVNNNSQSSLKLGHARGVLILTASLNNIKIAEYAPNAVKKTIAGYGSADKQQVAAMLKFLLPGCSFSGYDAADALAIALCHSANYRLLKEA